VREQIDRFLSFIANERRLSENTLAAYRNDLRQFADYVDDLQRSPMSEMAEGSMPNRESVAGFFLSLREDKGYSAATIARKMAAVKSMFQYLIRERIIADNPAADLGAPEVKKPLPKAISVGDVDRLLAQVQKKSSPEGIRDRAMLHLLYATGMRVSELVTLDLTDLDLANHSVRCVGRRARVRRLPIDVRTSSAIEQYLAYGRPALLRSSDSHPALFLNHRGQRLTRQGFWLIMKSIARESGVESDVTPHTLRHSFATHRLNEGIGIAKLRELLGHANISTTQIYAQIRTDVARPVLGRAAAPRRRVPTPTRVRR
jgi:integrase/recombinase XerD